jgi:hypothetical protein
MPQFVVNAGKCKSISFCRNMRTIEFVYSINGTACERADEIKDLGVIMNGRMSFLPHIEAIIFKLSRIPGFIKRISREFHDPYTRVSHQKHQVRFSWGLSAIRKLPTPIKLPHQSVHSQRLEQVQHNFIRYAVGRLP